MAEKIFKVILVLLVAGVVLYLFKSGIGSAIESIGSHSSSTTGNGFFGLVPPASNSGGGTPDGNAVSTSSAAGGTGPAINPADIPAGFTAGQLSPYFHEVRLGSVSYGSSYSYGEIELYASNIPASTTIDVTGWQIKTRDSGEFVPQAVNLYQPSGLTPPTDILMNANEQVYLYSSSGPFNLRLNECIGYISNENKTTPQIPDYCPSLNYAAIQNFTGRCQNYIESISSCEIPDLSNPEIPFNDEACRSYIANNFNYSSCFSAHESDPNFLSNEIWVWTGANVVDEYHNEIELLDRSGLLVDMYRY